MDNCRANEEYKNIIRILLIGRNGLLTVKIAQPEELLLPRPGIIRKIVRWSHQDYWAPLK